MRRDRPFLHTPKRGDLVAFIVAISCRVRGSRRRASQRANERERRGEERTNANVFSALLASDLFFFEAGSAPSPSRQSRLCCHPHRLLYFGNEDEVGPPIVRASGDARHLSVTHVRHARRTLATFEMARSCAMWPRFALFLARAISQSVSNGQFTTPHN